MQNSKERRAIKKRAKAIAPPSVSPKELKTAIWIALSLGVVAAAIFLWPVLFPVPKAQLVEVVWKHECSCASRWMDSLRAEGYTVRDFELDDTDTMRRHWRVPDSIQGCHPASYLGYFLDGHIPAAALRRLASERPQAIGLQRIDTVERGADGSEKLVPGELLLISGDGTATPWPPMQRGAKLP